MSAPLERAPLVEHLVVEERPTRELVQEEARK